MSRSVVAHPPDTRLRWAAATAALAAAAVYFLIGLGVVSVGTAKSGSAPDLFTFGAAAGTTFLVVAALLLRFRARPLWAAVAVLQVIVIVGYFAMADIRTPAVEVWGLLIKACQATVLAAVTVLFLHGTTQATR